MPVTSAGGLRAQVASTEPVIAALSTAYPGFAGSPFAPADPPAGVGFCPAIPPRRRHPLQVGLPRRSRGRARRRRGLAGNGTARATTAGSTLCVSRPDQVYLQQAVARASLARPPVSHGGVLRRVQNFLRKAGSSLGESTRHPPGSELATSGAQHGAQHGAWCPEAGARYPEPSTEPGVRRPELRSGVCERPAEVTCQVAFARACFALAGPDGHLPGPRGAGATEGRCGPESAPTAISTECFT